MAVGNAAASGRSSQRAAQGVWIQGVLLKQLGRCVARSSNQNQGFDVDLTGMDYPISSPTSTSLYSSPLNPVMDPNAFRSSSYNPLLSMDGACEENAIANVPDWVLSQLVDENKRKFSSRCATWKSRVIQAYGVYIENQIEGNLIFARLTKLDDVAQSLSEMWDTDQFELVRPVYVGKGAASNLLPARIWERCKDGREQT